MAGIESLSGARLLAGVVSGRAVRAGQVRSPKGDGASLEGCP